MTAYYKSSDLKNDLLPIYGDFIFRKMIEFVTIKFTKKKGGYQCLTPHFSIY
jgi:hypothetical protein